MFPLGVMQTVVGTSTTTTTTTTACVYDQCPGGIEVTGAGYSAVNGKYTAKYTSCDGIPNYGRAGTVNTFYEPWNKSNSDGTTSTISWWWYPFSSESPLAPGGWSVAHYYSAHPNGALFYFDGSNR